MPEITFGVTQRVQRVSKWYEGKISVLSFREKGPGRDEAAKARPSAKICVHCYTQEPPQGRLHGMGEYVFKV